MLNRCPSCNASVLDDDAEVCPFCGSPMDPAKAKGFQPAAKTAPAGSPETPKPTASQKPTQPVSVGKGPGKPPESTTAAKRPKPKSDDPFATDVAASTNAIPLSRKRTPQRPHQVVCPMCDTVGFAPATASGKEVRCANPECLVPVFTAPDFAAPKPVEPEPKSSLTPTLITFGAVAAILIGGAAFWWFALRKDRPESPAQIAVDNNPTTPQQNPVEPEETEPKEVAPAVPAPRETLAVAARDLANSAESVAQPQRQVLRRSLAAESFAMAGDIAAAKDQIQKINLNPSSDPFYKIAPLAEIAWQQLLQGDEAAAKATFDELSTLSTSIPPLGFEPARVVIDWSTIASRLGQEDAAHDLVQSKRDDGSGEQLLALLRAAALFNQHNFDAEYALRPVRPWREAKAVATTLELTNRGAREQALAWSNGFQNPELRAENLAAWAEASIVRDGTDASQRIAMVRDAVAGLDPAQTVYILARAALRSGSSGDQAAAKELLSGAVEAAGQIPKIEPYAAREIVELYQAELGDQSQVRFQVAALSEAVHAAAQVGQKDQAAQLLGDALGILAAALPSQQLVGTRQQELDSRGISGIASELKGPLNLTSDGQAESAANTYRRKLAGLREAVDVAAALRQDLLARATEWGLGAQVLEAQKAASEGEGTASLTGPLGGRLLGAAEIAGDKGTADAIRAAGVTNRDIPDFPALELTVRSLIKEGKLQDAGRQISDSRWRRIDRSEKLLLAIRTADQIVSDGSIKDTFEFVRGIGDEVTREEVYRSVAAFTGHIGRGHEVIDVLRQFRLAPTEQAALMRGLTEGLVATETAPQPAEVASGLSTSGA